MLPPKLDHLFIATFKDGTKIHQTPNDVSTLEPLTKSAFYDVLQRLSDVATFTLTNGAREHTVFLDDGTFNSDGKILVNPHGELTNFRLIYFRRMNQAVSGTFKHQPEVGSYFMGWQANDANGKNFQMVIEIKPTGSLKRAALL